MSVIVESEFSGGESVYCINQMQMRRAAELADRDPVSGPRIREAIRTLRGMSRNEQAAVAFLLLETLLKEPAHGAIPVGKAPQAAPR